MGAVWVKEKRPLFRPDTVEPGRLRSQPPDFTLPPINVAWVGRFSPTMSAEKRRHDRFYAELPVEIVRGAASEHTRTVDVSYGGLFVRTDRPPPLRQLVTLRIGVPDSDEPLVVMAMPVFIDAAGPDGTSPGVGLKLFGLDPAAQQKWDATIGWLKTQPDAEMVPPHSSKAVPPSLDLPLAGRALPELSVRMNSLADLEAFMNKDLVRGRVYVRADAVLEPGTLVEVRLIHPVTYEAFVLAGVMDQRVEKNGFVGVRVKLEALETETRVAFERFAQTGEVPASMKAAG